jgi:hypothetical protein
MMEKAGSAAQGANQSCQEVQQLMFLLIIPFFLFFYFYFVFGATKNNSQTGNIFDLTRKAYLIVLIQPTSMFKPHFVANCTHGILFAEW